MSITVLVVDDEEPVRKFVDRVFQDAGYQTVLASDGPEAIEVASKLVSLDILVTDVMMPLMAGDELARRLRQVQPSLKVLYLTGYADSLFKEKVTLWEDEAYLDKPCSIKGLLQATSLLLHGGLDAPQGLTACATNEDLTEVAIEFTRQTSTGQDVVYQTVKLTDASFAQIARFTGRPDGSEDTPSSGHTGTSDMMELERWALTFRKIELHDNDGNTNFVDNWTSAP